MASNERGLQNKADDSSRQQWEGGDFPMVCETCLGENPYLRMQKLEYAGTCKMCDRPYTVFKWRPGRGEGYRQTQVCQTCCKIKNLCQTCILDLQFGLPSQLRDAVLSQTDGTLAVPESDANREYFAAQHNALLASGNDPWQTGETPNEKLLKIARNTVQDRDQSKSYLASLAGKKRDSSAISYANTANNNEGSTTAPDENTADNNDLEENEIPLPPGMTLEAIKKIGASGSTGKNETLAQISNALKASSPNPSSKTMRPKPPKPAGPPPPWAFKNKTATPLSGPETKQ